MLLFEHIQSLASVDPLETKSENPGRNFEKSRVSRRQQAYGKLCSIFAEPKGEEFRNKEHFRDAQGNQQSASLPNKRLYFYVHLTSQVNAPLKQDPPYSTDPDYEKPLRKKQIFTKYFVLFCTLKWRANNSVYQQRKVTKWKNDSTWIIKLGTDASYQSKVLLNWWNLTNSAGLRSWKLQ